jgi:FemAB-related protein (PEP-CTERM system-associated)
MHAMNLKPAHSADTSAEPLRIRPMVDADRQAWDAFVADCPDATFFHRAGWRRVVEHGLRHRTHFLLAERGGAIEGVLPLAEVCSRLFGHNLVSLPCCVYGGVAAGNEDARRALTQEACRLADRLKVAALEMRNMEPREPGWPSKDLYVTFRKEISADPEENMKSIPRKQRAMVRKGIKAGLVARQEDHLGTFFDIYSESVRNLGTPVFPRRYFQALLDEFRSDCELSVISHEGQDIAAVMSFYFRDQVLPYYGGSRPAARGLKGNDFMYWDLMSRAAERGIRIFDYGRSKQGAGSYSFKKNWGFEPQPLHYEYHLVKASEMPEVNPNNPKYRYFIETWKRLPLPVANALGPILARNLG